MRYVFCTYYFFVLGDHFIENGAQWVHGEEGNKVFEIASSLKLLEVKEAEVNVSSSNSINN